MVADGLKTSWSSPVSLYAQHLKMISSLLSFKARNPETVSHQHRYFPHSCEWKFTMDLAPIYLGRPSVQLLCPWPLFRCGCLLTGALHAMPFWILSEKICSNRIDTVLEWRYCLCDCRNQPKENMKNKLPNAFTQLKCTNNASNQLSYNNDWEFCLG